MQNTDWLRIYTSANARAYLDVYRPERRKKLAAFIANRLYMIGFRSGYKLGQERGYIQGACDHTRQVEELHEQLKIVRSTLEKTNGRL